MKPGRVGMVVCALLSSSSFLGAQACDAQLAAECADGNAIRPACIESCVAGITISGYYGCEAEWRGYVVCTAGIPSAAENWDCSLPSFPPSPLPPNCAAEFDAVLACFYK